jgi:hypothetical protein
MKNSSDLRILHLVSSASGGAGIAASRMHNAMLKHNFESTIISRGGLSSKSINSSLKPGMVKYFNSKAITLFQSKVLQKDNLMTPFSINCVPKELIDFINPNIIHIHSFYNLIDLDGIKKILERKNCQVFITLHDQRFLTGGCHYSGECVGYLSECINCPSTYKIFQRYIHKQKVKSTDIFNESENGWCADTLNLIPYIKNKVIFFWIEDHICVKDINYFNNLVDQIYKYNIDYLLYSFFHQGKLLTNTKFIDCVSLNHFCLEHKNHLGHQL